MVISMTGYGLSETSSSNYSVIVELKSLNSRYLEVNSKIHESFYKYEHDIISLVRKTCKRGKVYINIYLKENSRDKKHIKINQNKLNDYILGVELLKKELNSDDNVGIDYFLKLPDIFEQIDSIGQENNKFILGCVKQALKGLNDHRLKEGKIIEKDILSKIKIIDKEIKKIIRLSAGNLDKEVHRIREKIESLIQSIDLDENRLYQEVGIILEKKDINEELSRLQGHLDLLKSYVLDKDEIGKKSNFLLQEINREINTIGAKVDKLSIKHIVVDIKNNIEQIREQVQNIL